MKKVMFSIFTIGILLSAVEVGSVTVRDSKTRLEWQDNYSDVVFTELGANNSLI